LFPWALTYSSQLPTYCLLLFLSLSRVSRPQGRPLEEEKENLFQLTGQKLIRKVEREKRKRIRVYAPQELD